MGATIVPQVRVDSAALFWSRQGWPKMPATTHATSGSGIWGVAGWLLIGAGSGLLALTLAGYRLETCPQPPDSDREHALTWCIERAQTSGSFDLALAVVRVHEGTKHSDERRIRPTEDWLQWSLGQFYEPLSHTQDASLLLKDGLTSCAERAQILKTMAEAAGLPCRFVGLQGHVVLEVQQDGAWCYADPDYGISFAAGVAEMSRPESLPQVARRLADRGWSEERIALYLHLLGTTEDNQTRPVGEPISPRLYWIEQACHVLRWQAPPLSILLGVILQLFFRRVV